jgi:hypothetical protein
VTNRELFFSDQELGERVQGGLHQHAELPAQKFKDILALVIALLQVLLAPLLTSQLFSLPPCQRFESGDNIE